MVEKIRVFFQKRDITLQKQPGVGSPGTQGLYFWWQLLHTKIPESSDYMYSSFFMLENIRHHHFTWSGPNLLEIMNFVPIVGPRGPELNCNKFAISCEIGPFQVKWWYLMFSSTKKEEYMQSELSGIFWL